MQHEQPWTVDDFVNHTFPTTRFGRGYDQDEVDHFLDRCIVQLRVHLGQPAPTHDEQLATLQASAVDRSTSWLSRLVARWMLRSLAANPGFGVVDARPISALEIAQHEFTVTQFRDGYDPTDVDAVLDRIAEQLEAHERRAAPDAQPTLDAHG